MAATMDGDAAVKKLTTFDEAWSILKEGVVNKLIDNLEIDGLPNNKYFTSEEYMRFYTVFYNIATARPTSPEPQEKKLYDQYKRTVEDYFSSKVLPSLRGKESENLLREFLRRWNNHKTMTRWLTRFFDYISRYYIPRIGLLSLEQTSYLTFYNRVYGEIKDQVNDAIKSLIDRGREGEQIDQIMVKQVLDIFEEIGEDVLMKHYAKNINNASVSATDLVCSDKGLNCIATKSYENYMLQVKECFKEGETRVSESLRLGNMDKVLEVYGEIKDQVNDAIFSLAMVTLVLDIFRNGEDTLENYAEDIEERLDEEDIEEPSDGEDIDEPLDVEDIEELLDEEDIEEPLDEDYVAEDIVRDFSSTYKDRMLRVQRCFENEKNRLSEYLTLDKQEQSI